MKKLNFKVNEEVFKDVIININFNNINTLRNETSFTLFYFYFILMK